MTPEEIIEGNKLIAEFDGGEINEYHISGIPKEKWLEVKFERDNEINSVRIDELQYHSSFDWLMPVVEKIENDYTITIRDKTCEIVKDFAMPTHEVMFCNHSKESKIEAIWLSVIDFIWYNQTKK